ncbi:hypothetical protein BC938DRAFT_479729, partial [Jimgerdemannia flammicorona]
EDVTCVLKDAQAISIGVPNHPGVEIIEETRAFVTMLRKAAVQEGSDTDNGSFSFEAASCSEAFEPAALHKSQFHSHKVLQRISSRFSQAALQRLSVTEVRNI